MKTILYFSYKGGAGRSLALCNTAAALCRQNLRVGIIDFDVEAPSIHIHMKGVLPTNYFSDDTTPDILTLLRTDSEHIIPQAVEEASIKLDLPLSNTFCVLLPCFGREDDVEDLELQWREKVSELEKIFEMFGNSYKLDFLLVDSRTGYSQQAILTAFSSTEVVAVSRADEVSISGMKLMLDIFKGRPMKVHLLVTSIPETIPANDKRLRSFVKALDQASDTISTSYVPEWYFGGQVIWRQTKKNRNIIEPYNKLARNLLGMTK